MTWTKITPETLPPKFPCYMGRWWHGVWFQHIFSNKEQAPRDYTHWHPELPPPPPDKTECEKAFETWRVGKSWGPLLERPLLETWQDAWSVASERAAKIVESSNLYSNLVPELAAKIREK